MNYDPLALVLEGVRPGTLGDRFDLGLTVLEDTGGVTLLCAAARDFTVAEGGTLAVLDLRGATTPHSGLLRPLATDGTYTAAARMGEGAITVAPGTTLKTLALAEGDALGVEAGKPVVITEALEGRVAFAPFGGAWTPGRYEVLRLPQAKARAAVDFDLPEHGALTWQTEGTDTVYTLEIGDGTVLAKGDDGTEYTTLDAIPAGATVTPGGASPLFTDNNTLATVGGKTLGGQSAYDTARLLVCRFVARKEMGDHGPTTLTYSYDLGIQALEVRRDEKQELVLDVLVALEDDELKAGAPNEGASRTLEGRRAIVTAANGAEYACENPTFAWDGRRGRFVCRVAIPWESLPEGTTPLTVRIEGGDGD